MLNILLVLAMTGSIQAPHKSYIQIIPTDQLTHVLVFNQDEKSLKLWESLSLNSLDGILSFSFSKNGRAYKKLAEGQVVDQSSSTIQVMPGFIYGVSIPTDYLQVAYGLESGCYEVSIKLRLPPQKREKTSHEIISNQPRVCFSFERKGK